MNNNLKLYVWEGVLVDYTEGVMFALANNVKEARKILLEKDYSSSVKRDLKQRPKVYTTPFALTVWGGG